MLRLRLPRSGALLGLLATLLCLAGPAWAGQVTVDFLDVGQGDAILIRGGGRTVLIDAGESRARVDEQLIALDVGKLDLVVATHPHADHVGGMEVVVRSFEIGVYLDNGLPHTTATYNDLMAALEEQGVRYKPARSGQHIKLGDEAMLHVLFPNETPLKDTRSDLNSNSVVLWLQHGTMDFLFTGDAEEPTEQALLAAGLPEGIEVLKVAHHGSSHSSTSTFLNALSPDFAVISCGSGNRYGHPDPEALTRLKQAGATVFRTDLSGHVRAISDGTEIEFMEGLLPQFRGESERGVSGQPPGTVVAGTTAATPVATATDPVPASDVDLSGVQAPNPIFDDLRPGKKPKKARK